MEQRIPNYNEARLRIKKARDFFEKENISINPFTLSNKQFEDLREKVFDFSKNLAGEFSQSSLNPNIDGLEKHLLTMEEVFSWLFEFDEFKNLLPIQARDNFNFLRFLVLAHDFERFIFNGPFPLNYIDQVGDALNERVFFPGFDFSPFLHRMDYITGRKKAPSSDDFPLVYIFKAVDSLAKPGRDPKLFLEREYDQWLEQQIQRKRFPIRIRNFEGKIIEVLADEYREKDIAMIRQGVDIISRITNLSSYQVFDKIREVNFSFD
ncbi:MAG: hypothetical protein NZM02_00495 [Patescibacteria group bacterium]|nr:hypothetical protein [Patescibacteria group bacterium]